MPPRNARQPSTGVLVPRPSEAELRPEPPAELVAQVAEGMQELGKGKRYRYFYQVPGAAELSRMTQVDEDRVEGTVTNAQLLDVVDRSMTLGHSTPKIALELGRHENTIRRWLKIAEQRGLINAHHERVTAELGPLAVEALKKTLSESKPNAKAALGVLAAIDRINAHVAKKEAKYEDQEETLEQVIEKMRRRKDKARAIDAVVVSQETAIGEGAREEDCQGVHDGHESPSDSPGDDQGRHAIGQSNLNRGWSASEPQGAAIDGETCEQDVVETADANVAE